MNLGILALLMPATMASPPLPPMPAAFTFAQVVAPQGARTTWYPGTTMAVAVNGVMPVGLRPGYVYRFEISGVGDRKTETIYPSIEVRGSLIPRQSINITEHPVPLILTEEDIARILEGRFLSKIYYLEDPERAVNGAVVGVPVELNAPTEAEAIKEARSRGRIMIVLRAGERSFSREELAVENVPGTILFPGSKVFPTPACPPRLPFGGIPLFDPILGPAIVGGQECLFDGGDSQRPLGIGKENKLYGLDPSDTAIEFTTQSGKKVSPSNRVCICVPRFAVMRSELNSNSYQVVRGPQYRHQMNGQFVLLTRVPALNVERIEQPIGAIGQVRPSGAIGETIPFIQDTFMGTLAAVSTLKGLRVTAQLRETDEITAGCDALILVKRMDPPHPKQIGEIVTFYLRYTNPTNQPMTEVAVSDSLTGRLEYIEGSAKSDRATSFSAIPNEANSVVLRWAIDGKLLPGQSGLISFKARIR